LVPVEPALLVPELVSQLALELALAELVPALALALVRQLVLELVQALVFEPALPLGLLLVVFDYYRPFKISPPIAPRSSVLQNEVGSSFFSKIIITKNTRGKQEAYLHLSLRWSFMFFLNVIKTDSVAAE
jgi:hypothetical protein